MLIAFIICLVTVVLRECCRHDIEKITNEIVNKTTSDLRQLSSLTAQTLDNRVSECPAYCGESHCLTTAWLLVAYLT